MNTGVSDLDYTRVAEWNFCRSYEDLKDRSYADPAEGNRYRMLGIAPLLRKLLFDGTPLLHAANGRRKVQIYFPMRVFPFTVEESRASVAAAFPGHNIGPDWRHFVPDWV